MHSRHHTAPTANPRHPVLLTTPCTAKPAPHAKENRVVAASGLTLQQGPVLYSCLCGLIREGSGPTWVANRLAGLWG